MFWTVNLDGGPKRVNHAAVRVGQHIFSFGGYNKNVDFEEDAPISVYVLNTATLRWTEIHFDDDDSECVPFQRYGLTAIAYGTDVIVWGGRNDVRACNKVFIFDTRKGEWRCPSVTGEIPPARDGHSACLIDDRMYVFGGFLDDFNVFCDNVFCLDLKNMDWTHIEVQGKVKPPGRDFHSAAVVGSRMYIIGGRGQPNVPQHNVFYQTTEKYWSSVYYFETNTNTWRKPSLKGDIPVGRRSLSTFVFDGSIYMFGGCNGSMEKHFNDLYVFNPRNNRWREIKPLGTAPSVRRRQSCVVVDDRAFIFGGTCPKPKKPVLFHLPPDINSYLDGHCSDLEDLDDMHILELRTPKLRTLAIMKVIQNNLSTESLPAGLKIDIRNMTMPNRIPP